MVLSNRFSMLFAVRHHLTMNFKLFPHDLSQCFLIFWLTVIRLCTLLELVNLWSNEISNNQQSLSKLFLTFLV